MKKKLIVVNLILLMIVSVSILISCGKKDDGKIHIVSTIASTYDWTNELTRGANDCTNTLLIDGCDVHSYQPSAKDIKKINDCDLFIYVGGENGKWVDDVVKQSNNKNRRIIKLLDVLKDNLKEEEVVEGMEGDIDDADEGEIDEHVWLSVKNAIKCVNAIYNNLLQLLPEDNELLERNKFCYDVILQGLDNYFISLLEDKTTSTLVICDRFPFRYLVDDYNINYYAAFVGCSTEINCNAKTIKFLSDKVDELNLKYIVRLASSNGSIAKSVNEATKDKNHEIVVVNSLENLTTKQINNGETYAKIMKDNFDTFAKCLLNK